MQNQIQRVFELTWCQVPEVYDFSLSILNNNVVKKYKEESELRVTISHRGEKAGRNYRGLIYVPLLSYRINANTNTECGWVVSLSKLIFLPEKARNYIYQMQAR